jgi:ribosomal protein S1
VKDFGVFVELEPGISGLVHASRLPSVSKDSISFHMGKRIIVEIQSVNAIKKTIDIVYVIPRLKSLWLTTTI